MRALAALLLILVPALALAEASGPPAAPSAIAPRCGAAPKIDIKEIADAVSGAAMGDVEKTTVLAELPVKAKERVRRLIETHSIAVDLIKRAYFTTACEKLELKGLSAEELEQTRKELAKALELDWPVKLAATAGKERRFEFMTETEPYSPVAKLDGEDAKPKKKKKLARDLASPAPETAPAEGAAAEAAPEAGPVAGAAPPPSLAAPGGPAAGGSAPDDSLNAPSPPPAAPAGAPKRITKNGGGPDAMPRPGTAPGASGGGGSALPDDPAPDASGRGRPVPRHDEESARGEDARMTAEEGRMGRARRGRAPESKRLDESDCRALGVLESCTDFSAVLDQLLERPLEYNHPKTMFVGRKTEISLVLRTDWKGKDLPKEISEELKGLPGEVKQAISKVTQVMSARLAGREFEIEPAGMQERTVTTAAPVVWSWLVTPGDTGRAKKLKLELYAHIRDKGETKPPLLIKTLDASIDVDVKTWDWIVAHAKTMEPIYTFLAALLGLLAASLGFLYRRLFARKAGKEASAKPVATGDSQPV